MLWLLNTYHMGGTIPCSSTENQIHYCGKTSILLERERIATNENVG